MASNLLLNSGKLMMIAALFGLIFQIDESRAFNQKLEEEGKCSFSKKLQDQGERYQFQAQVNAAKEASTSRFGEVFTNSATLTYPDGETMEIDTFSMDCLSCHDGISAPSREIRYKNNRFDKTASIESVTGSHPIGMHYGSYAYGSREYKSINSLDPAMVLVDGKVGCLTCHNPLNPKKLHLAKEIDRSKLCFTCHNI